MLTTALNNAIKVIVILLGILWTIAAIPPVINTYYYLGNRQVMKYFSEKFRL